MKSEDKSPFLISKEIDKQDVKAKSFYEIHGRFPEQEEALFRDGLYFFLDSLVGPKSKPCECLECKFQRENYKDLALVYKIEQKLKRIKYKNESNK